MPNHLLDGRSGRVAWVVSNCNAHNLRWEYAQELSRYIDVDVYGKCGSQECDKERCFEELGKKYKFLLAFENSNCADYISEKFLFNAISFGMLPVVMGATRYEYEQLGVPNSSFIHVDDFQHPRHLAAYLHRLHRNRTEYRSFWNWRDSYEVVYLRQTRYFCRLCALLHLADATQFKRFYRDYSRWWNVCRT